MKRFISMDPLGYVDSMNMYESFGCDPVNNVDPLGLRECSISNEEAMELIDIGPLLNNWVQKVIDEYRWKKLTRNASERQIANEVERLLTHVKKKLAGTMFDAIVTPIERKIEKLDPQIELKKEGLNPGDFSIDSFVLFKPISKTIYAGAAEKYPNKLRNMTDAAIAPGVNINGYAIGIDKIGHFFQQGYTYYKKNKKLGKDAAEKYYTKLERSAHGMGYPYVIITPLGNATQKFMTEEIGGISGVFSYADLEANRQGGKFYQDLAEHYRLWLTGKQNTPYRFQISKYVNILWDENINLNDYIPEMQKIVDANNQISMD